MNTHVGIDTVGCRLSMATELAEKACTSCRGGIPPLAAEAPAMVRRDEAREAITRDLEAARYAADRAFGQYDAPPIP